MKVRVSYIGEPKTPTDIVDRYFGTLEEAREAPFPEQALFAFILADGGYFSRQKGFAWQYHSDDASTPR